MVLSVFGAPVTSETLKGMPKYANKTTTRLERAREALNNQNANGKADQAAKIVDQLKEKYGDGPSTKCMIYNATGDKVTFVLSHDYHGHIYDMSPYPVEIENGQWGAFLHVHSSGAAVGSSAAVVYHGLNNDDEGRDWCLSWITPWSSVLYNNYAYAEVRETDHYYTDRWDYINSLMEKAGQTHVDKWGGCVSKGTIGSGTTVYYTGIMTLEGA